MNKKHFWGVLVVLAISAWVLYQDLKTTPFHAILQAAQKLDLFQVTLALGAMLLSYVCEAGILAILAKPKGARLRLSWPFLRVPLIQALFNAITPLSTGGQPAQLVALAQMGMSGGKATSLLMMKFIIYQIVVLFADVTTIFSGYALVMTKFSGLSVFIMIGFLIHVVSIVFLLAVMFAYHKTKQLSQWLFRQLAKALPQRKVAAWQKSLMVQIDTFYAEGQKLKKEKKKLLGATLLTIIQLTLFYSITYFVLCSLKVSVSWLPVVQLNIMIIILMAIVPIPGASGGAEYSFQTLFATFTKQRADLVLGMFLWRFITYFLGMLLGLIGWIFKPKPLKSH